MSYRPKHDNIYAQPQAHISGFTFDEAVVNVFPDMINRSVPGYQQMIAYLGLWAERYAQPHTNLYDLGCSLGASTFSMRQRVRATGSRIVAVDNAPAMIERCHDILAELSEGIPVDFVLGDLQTTPLENASVVVLNFTLQFVAAAERDAVIQRIYDALVPGGILILSEKVMFANPLQNKRFIDIHHEFKAANGYSALEIAQKRTSLENVLVPETIDAHRERLLAAGFDSAELWFQAINFASLIAIK